MDEFHKIDDVGLYWLGQMGLLIKAGGETLCIDYFASPFEGRRSAPPIAAEELHGINVFLGTHDHLDHIDHDAWKIWAVTNPDARFVFPRAHMEAVLADGIDPANATGLNAGESVSIGAFTIHALPAAHEFLNRDPDTGLYPCLQYVIEAGGFRIHHAGDTLRYEGLLPGLLSCGKIDVSLLPINGRDAKRYRTGFIGNMTFQEAVDLAGETAPRIVIPGHWDMFADNSGDPEAFADYLDAKYPGQIRCIIPEIMKKISLD